MESSAFKKTVSDWIRSQYASSDESLRRTFRFNDVYDLLGEGIAHFWYRKSDGHISRQEYDISVTCTNILSYSDITYMVFSIVNRFGVSYDCPDATFVVESRKRSRKTVVYDRNIFPKSRWGTISCAPGETTSIGYSLEKVSLAKDQVLKVYFY